jgi:hypothetical protein
MSLTSYRAAPSRGIRRRTTDGRRQRDRHFAWRPAPYVADLISVICSLRSDCEDGFDERVSVFCSLSSVLCVKRSWRRPALPRLEPEYHGRWRVSRPSSGWDRVGPRRFCCQDGIKQKSDVGSQMSEVRCGSQGPGARLDV